ncbi:MAG TPA: STAS domain-containing protein [bacterium]|nr:STAS domain-containing protein [bacterium]HPR86971.1 STAS domain-containing protein [bacterium]
MAVRVMTMNNLDIAVVSMRGALVGGEECDELKSSIADLFEQGNRKLIIDMSGITYCNSLGIGTLVGLHTMYSRGGGHIRLCEMGKGIQNLFVITKLISVFEVEESRDEAIASFQTMESINH